ncbi:terminase [Dellaglioa algida]|uniref:Terminase n=1 Tax=Dellaglioa algida TaxID=105612 RepID=A0A5C6M842_9LACO|nr:terminase TerL endonuclease subunit [Dellaglioa algida]MDK1716399.1 terminase large subunit [Dellaglioa algida]MDK1720247.1 terminase large subunit [Dellaglioa algida]MDK1721340.1 terminase large subunit [Dellaglioa algida]TWW10225.1 terminase [Dellaglioa algida]
MSSKTRDWSSIYCEAILSGDILASNKVKQACERHLSDLKRKDFKYVYDIDRANKIIRYIEKLPDIKTGVPNKLALFQKFILSQLYGWVDDKGNRRFQKAYVSMARKNGKTILVSGIASYEFLYGKNPRYSRQIYCTANSKEQAKIAFSMVVKQLEKVRSVSSSINKRIRKVQNELTDNNSYSILRPLSKDTGSIDGFEPLVGILDEYHESKTTEMMEVLESGQTLLENPLTLIISTAGFNLNSPMYLQEYPYIMGILKGTIENDNYFAFCAEQDSEEEIENVDNWIKSNPLLEVDSQKDIMLKNIRKKLSEAQEKQDLGKTLTKNFNIWQSAMSESYLKGSDWKKSLIDLEPIINGKDVYIGLDLARVGDLSAVSWIIPIEETNQFYVNSHAFVGTRGGIENKSKRDQIDYARLKKMNFVTFSERDTGLIDDNQIVEYIDELVTANNLNVKFICYDRYSANNIINELSERYQMVDVAQGFATLSEPTKQFKKFVINGDIVHTNNVLLEIAVNNAILKNNNDAVQIDKSMYRNKIDPLAALMDAWTEAVNHDFENKGKADNDYYKNDFSF